MDDFAIDAVRNVSRAGVFSSLAVTSNDSPQSSVEAWGTAMAACSTGLQKTLEDANTNWTRSFRCVMGQSGRAKEPLRRTRRALGERRLGGGKAGNRHPVR
jgi:hypothetical protein